MLSKTIQHFQSILPMHDTSIQCCTFISFVDCVWPGKSCLISKTSCSGDFFFSCPLLIPCPSPSADPQKLFLCDCFVLWQDDIDAYKTQNQFLNSEIHQVTRLWTRVAENEKALLMKVRQNSSFSLGTAFSKFFPKWALG